jgi:ectoine hydroxylase-related dioxygenase (phytanoyl-CoA dioxygenase family)
MIAGIKEDLKMKGYCIVPNVLTVDEITEAKTLFNNWKNSIPNFDKVHNTIDPHGIFKFHEIGHQEHAWYIRTNPQVIDIFKKIWETDELIVSFDGSCYISKELSKKDNIWTHTDQAPNSKGLHCYQGFVALTDNKERTLVVYEGSHNYHEKYFDEKKISDSKNWHLIDHEKLEELKESKKTLEIPAGSLVLWDSRTFHQNQYGKSNLEERIVQYVCYLPKSHPKNTKSQQTKRLKYFEERRTTSHWPCPINVNGLQPQTYGDKSKEIDYTTLKPPNLERFMSAIKTIL